MREMINMEILERIRRLESTFSILQSELLKAQKELSSLSSDMKRILKDEKTRENQSLGLLIRTSRLKKNLSLRKLSKTLGIHESLLSKIESGERRPKKKILEELTQLLEIPSMENLSTYLPILKEIEIKVRENQKKRQLFLGKLLRSRRKLLGLTLEEVAKSSGLSLFHLSCIERGQYFPRDSTLQKLVSVLQIGNPIDHLKNIKILRLLLEKTGDEESR
jgi:transcriptional regulator with XRE-family HTH domain